MTQSKTLTIIAHCPSDNTREMASALKSGAEKIEGINVQLKSPFDCDHQTVLTSNALILFTTENFGYMSGALKDFFERVYYPCLDQPEKNEAKPYCLLIKAGLDGTGTKTSVHKIIKGLRWKEAAPLLLCKGDFNDDFIEQCQEKGQTMAALLDADII